MTELRFAVRRRVAFAAALALAGALLAGAGAEAKPASKCHVVNSTQHTKYVTVQSAVDAASAGDTLRVKGTCVGTTTIGKSLTIVGQPKATLDGDHTGSVVTIGDDAMVTMSDLIITHGSASQGGGIRLEASLTLIRSIVIENTATSQGGGIYVLDNGSGILTLDQGSVVTANTSNSAGGGIYSNHGGPIILNDTSSVHHNTATYGGGIEVGEAYGVTLNDTSSVHDNVAIQDGGGVATSHATTVLNDASSIYNNSAERGAGAFNGGPGAELTINDQGSIHDNAATTGGGGIWNGVGSTNTNCVAGVNVFDNVPDDIFTESP